jgi:DNA primase
LPIVETMEVDNFHFSIKDEKQIDMIEYLERLGYQPKNIRNHTYWYMSPFQDEKTPYFKVNKTLNSWYDFGLGKGGIIIDFGIEYFKCSVKEFLDKLIYRTY